MSALQASLRSLVHLTCFHNEGDFSERVDVLEGVAFDRDYVRELSSFNSPDLLFHSQELRCCRCRGPQRIERLHSVFDHFIELPRGCAVFERAHVGAEYYLHSRLHGFLKDFSVTNDYSPSHIGIVFAGLWNIDGERRTPEYAAFDQQFDSLVVHQHSVLYRPGAAAYRILRAVASIGMSRDIASPSLCFFDDRAHLID